MSGDLEARLRADLNAARKRRDRFGTLVISTTLADVRNRAIEHGGPLTDDLVRQVVARAVKQRRDAAEQMRMGRRPELAEAEEAEAELLLAYLPDPLSADEVRAIIEEAVDDGVVALGPLMGRIMPKIQDRFDGSEANRIAREVLAR